MSEHKVGNFIREHKKAEVAAGAGTVLAGAAVAAAFIQRRKRRHELHTFSTEDLTDRIKIFDFEDEETLTVNMSTRLAGIIHKATTNGINGGASLDILYGSERDDMQLEVAKSLDELERTGFVVHGTLNDGSVGYRATSDMQRVLEETDSVLTQTYYS